jgi:hypothetical protein
MAGKHENPIGIMPKWNIITFGPTIFRLLPGSCSISHTLTSVVLAPPGVLFTLIDEIINTSMENISII